MNSTAGDWLDELRVTYPELDLFPPAAAESLVEVEKTVGQLPDELRDLLRRSNGLVCRSFRLYSAFDREKPKKTWESLQRANDPAKTHALGGDRELLGRFLVFADIGGGHALFERSSGSIWFEEPPDDQVRQTDLGLREFVETLVQNAE